MKKILLGLAAFLTVLAGGYGVNELGVGRGNYQERTMLNEVATTTWSSAFNVADYQHPSITVAPTAATSTLKVACSFQELAPTFSSAQSATNRWDYVQIIDMEDASSIDGDTGLPFTGTTDVRQFDINQTGFRWCAVYNNWTSGTTTVKLIGSNNQ